MVKTALPIPPVARFRYFEVEVLENKVDANVYLGIIEQQDAFSERLDRIEQLSGE